MPDSKRSSKGFQQIPESSPGTMVNPNDATIEIPLTGVTSKTGARRTDTYASTTNRGRQAILEQQNNEKVGFYQRHVAGRRKTTKKTGHTGEDGEEDALNHMGIIYNKILNFSIVTRYFLYVLPLAIFISIPIIIGATAAQNATIGGVRIVWIFSWLLIVWLSLWVSKLAARCLPAIFQFLCGIVSAGTRKYALVIRALEIYLSLSGWALASLATFIPVMTRNPTQRAQAATFTKNQNSTSPALRSDALQYQNATAVKDWESIVQKILAALLVSSLILLAEKLLIQLISIGYHRTQFHAKIKESKHKIYLISLLYDASRSLFPAYCPEFAEEDYIINDSIEFAGNRNGNQSTQSGSATPLRILQNVGRVGDKLTSAFGNIAHEVTGKQVFNPNSAHSIVVEALEKNRSSEALAKRLWMSFVVEGKEALYLEDVVEVLGVDHHDEAEEAFAVLDRDNNGDISLDEMILTVCEFGKERHSIATSLQDVDQAINVLDGLLCTIIFVVVIFIFVAFLNSSFTTTLATAGTALLSLSFVFASTAQEVLGSCIFLFVKHPFDVLDRVDIGDDQLIVKHISLLFTVFKHVKTHKLTQVPNIVLNSLWVQNVSRSEAMREHLSLYISFDTSLEDVQLLKNEMQAFVRDKDNSRDFQPDIDVEITGIAEMNKLELKVEIRHKSNWSNETVRAARRSKFMCALVLALRKVPINAPGGGDAALGSSDKPTYSVSVSDTEAAANREAFAKAKDAKRLFPTRKNDDSSGRSPTRGVSSNIDALEPRDSITPPPLRFRRPLQSESDALNTLNSRHPAADTAHNPNDLIETNTPKSVAHSVSGTITPPDVERSVSIEEVRGLLRRQSTRGKRKASIGSSKLPSITTSIKNRPPPPSGGFDYEPYTYPTQRQQAVGASPYNDPPSAQQPPAQTQQQQQRSTQSPSPTRFPKAPSPTRWPKLQQNPQEQQRPSTPQSSSVPQPVPQVDGPPEPYQPMRPPKEKSFPIINPNSTASLPNPADPPAPYAESPRMRSASPIRNPYQINALRSQAQGVAVPRVHHHQVSDSQSGGQIRRPVPGSGNAFANEAAREGAARPPREDSLDARGI